MTACKHESTPRLVILESPYAGDVDRNVAYARAAMADCLRRGEAPIASHLLYTQPGVLDDDVPEERRLGIDAGLAWGRVADAAVFYTDLGYSAGMRAALERHRAEGREVEERRLSWWAATVQALGIDAALEGPGLGQPSGDDEGPCTDCWDTGITVQTERRCACQPITPDEAMRKPIGQFAGMDVFVDPDLAPDEIRFVVGEGLPLGHLPSGMEPRP